MLKRFNDSKKKNDFILTTNYLTEIINKESKHKKYSSKQITALNFLIDPITSYNIDEHIDKVITYVFENNINLQSISAVSLNYKTSQNTYKHNKEILAQLGEFKIFKNELKSAILNKKEYILVALSEQLVNKSRQRSNLFKKYIEQISNDSTLNSFSNIQCVFDILEAKKLFNSDCNLNFIFVPSTDKDLTVFLKETGLYSDEHKGRDFFARYNGYYFIAEAKEIVEEGGGQNNQFNDMSIFANKENKNKKIINFGIIYGGCCLYPNTYQSQIDNSDNIFTLSELTFETKECFGALINNNLEDKDVKSATYITDETNLTNSKPTQFNLF